MRRLAKKLTLSGETIRRLDAHELGAVGGGVSAFTFCKECVSMIENCVPTSFDDNCPSKLVHCGTTTVL